MKKIWPVLGSASVFIGASFILDAVTQQYTFVHNIVPMVFFISGVSMLFALGVALAADFVQDRYLSMKVAHKNGGKIDKRITCYTFKRMGITIDRMNGVPEYS
jgi:hypothetical protein